jgi:5-formyltetrahydrofolate cyclo-ligase
MARTVALFASLEDEPATRPIFEALRGRDRSCFFPRCRDDGGLDLVEIGAWGELEPGHYGILEPPDGRPPIAPENLDLILVPGVAFDARGGRLGRGRGFYDRVLPRAGEPGAPIVFGLAFEFQIVDRVPTGERDRPVDAILTDQGLKLADRDF